jgi:hypothetical protein
MHLKFKQFLRRTNLCDAGAQSKESRVDGRATEESVIIVVHYDARTRLLGDGHFLFWTQG